MHRKLTIFLICLIAVLIFKYQPVCANYNRKDPFLSAAFSWFIPGLGQAYSARPARGGLFWLIDKSLLWGTILTIADVNMNFESDVGFRFSIKFKDNPSKKRIITTIGLGIGFIIFHIYNVIDASDCAHAYNKKYLMEELKKEGLSMDIRDSMAGIKYSYRF